MIKVMIVEDEPPIARAIKLLIERYKGDFEVTAVEFNGRKALKYLEENRVDAIFSDIRMPVMDGLELAEKVQQLYPDVTTVIFSGYQDFEYARRALQYQVYDYISKPVSEETMFKLLKKLEVSIQTKQQEKRKKELQAALHNQTEVSPSYGSEYAVFLVCAGAFPQDRDESMLPGGAYWQSTDLEAVLKSSFPEKSDFLCFQGKTYAEKIILAELPEHTNYLEMAEKVFNALQKQAQIPITLVANRALCEISSAGNVFKALRSKLFRNILFCSPSLIWSDEEENSSGAAVFAEYRKPLISVCIKGANASAHFEKALADFHAHKVTQLEVVQFFEALLDEIVDGRLSDRSIAFLKIDIGAGISGTSDRVALAKDLSALFCGIFADNAGKNAKQNDELINQIEAYIRENYNKNITSGVLSAKFGLVPSYLSKLFRDAKGVSPSEFLTKLRVSNAKEIMAKNPSLLIKEVADTVGYTDQYYFSKIFKKETGIWPSEYIAKKAK